MICSSVNRFFTSNPLRLRGLQAAALLKTWGASMQPLVSVFLFAPEQVRALLATAPAASFVPISAISHVQ